MEKLLDIFKEKAYINGEWAKAISGKTYGVLNPASGKTVVDVADMDEKDTEKAIEVAYDAWQTWKETTAYERAALLKKWYQLLIENKDELGKLLTLEQGKPLKEAIGEIVYGASYVEWFAEEARRNYGDIIPSHEPDKRMFVIKQPVGVVGIITPWNFPNAMITRKVAPALAAGCTVVIKPAAQTPLSALALAHLAEEAGIPKGVINIVTSTSASEIGKVLTSHALIRKISFTGSTAVGKILMEQSASTLKRMSLELGGNAPFIVLDDADLDAAVQGAMQSKFRNAGQTCVCANRIYVHESVKEEFVAKYKKAMQELTVGDGMKNGVEIGPLIDEDAVEKVKELLADAKDKGATVKLGGQPHELGGTFFEPTLLVDVTPEMRFSEEEIFGPVAPIYTFKTDEEAIQLANDTNYGLAAYFYGQNVNRIVKLAEALETGMVGVNTGLVSSVAAPFGGIKESGFGREGSKYGLDEYTEKKYICLAGVK